MKRIIILSTIAALAGSLTAHVLAAETNSEDRAEYLYCKHDGLKSEPGKYVCNTGFGKTPNAACVGGVIGSIDKENVEKVDNSIAQCNNGRWYSRLKLKQP